MRTKIGTVRRGREIRRWAGRTANEALLARAEMLPAMDRLIAEQVWGQGMPLKTLARLHRVSVSQLSRRVRRMRASLASPCFLLTTQFADRLPAGARGIAKSYYVDQLTLQECAVKHHNTVYGVRQALAVVKSALVLAAHNSGGLGRKVVGEESRE